MSEDALHRDDPAGVLLPRTINNSHPAATYLLQNFVMTEPPVGVGHIRFCENALKCFPRRFAFGFESFVQETVDARSLIIPDSGAAARTLLRTLTCAARRMI